MSDNEDIGEGGGWDDCEETYEQLHGIYMGPMGGMFGGFRQKSEAAKRREEAVKKLFLECKDQLEDEVEEELQISEEAREQQGGKKQKKVEKRHYLTDGVPHLTAACWKTFGRFVKEHQGWVPKREMLTNDEKALIRPRSDSRSGKMYKISVVYSIDLKKKADAGGLHWEKESRKEADAAPAANSDSAKKRKREGAGTDSIPVSKTTAASSSPPPSPSSSSGARTRKAAKSRG